MLFRTLFSIALKELFQRIFKKINVLGIERLSRFIFSRKHYTSTHRRVKYVAFIPNLNNKSGKLETSVFRTSDLSINAIWEIGDFVEGIRNIKATNTQSVKAYANNVCARIRKCSLKVEKETSTHKLHGNTVGWPKDKEAQMELAILIVNKAVLRIK